MEKIIAKKVTKLQNPEVAYDRILPSISFSPMIIDGKLKYQASFSCRLGREINEHWDLLPGTCHVESFGDIEKDCLDDQDLSELVSSINTSIAKFLSSRGV